MAEDCQVCQIICTVSTGDAMDDECHTMLDEFAQSETMDTADLCDALEEEFDMSCDDLPFTIPQ